MSEDVPRQFFATTHWSLVLGAGQSGSPEADRALAELCRVYWYPLYAYVRRFGHGPQTAEDLTQEFFAKLLEKNYLGTADRQRGKFRWFLLTAFKCFLANEHDRATAQKRGGGRAPIALDALDAEQRYAIEPATTLAPDQLFDLRWALDVLDRVRVELATEQVAAGKSARFEVLKQYLPGGIPAQDYATTGTALGMSEAAVKQEVHRIKRRYGELLRAEIGKTVASPDEVDDEIRYLIDVVCRR
ncbi:MAG: RNA polymerase sigma factor [Limisphaerales bacterium]